MGFWTTDEDIEEWFWKRVAELDKEGYVLIKEDIKKLSNKEFTELIKKCKKQGYKKFILTLPLHGKRYLLAKK